ncbi:MAG: 50S ribosomal protein L31 [Candidatus Oxydemutatoraceae bacterium WSBS_2016_MAG_OTU14]
MKTGIHPTYKDLKVICTCGSGRSYTMRSTYHEDELRVEVCSHCHPFYTGKQKVLGSAGQIEKFNKRFGKKS